MNRLTTVTAALVLALAGGFAHADSGDSSMSILTGDSYAYFEAARTGKPHVDVQVARSEKAKREQDEREQAKEKERPLLVDTLSERYERTNPFRDDTA